MGIYPAALRRAPIAPHVREGYLVRGLEVIRSYLGVDRDRPPPLYPRSSALATQWLFALVERDDPNDKPLIERPSRA